MNNLEKFEQLKELLIPYESKLNLPGGIKLSSIDSEIAHHENCTEDFLLVKKLGLISTDNDLFDIFGSNGAAKNILFDMQAFFYEKFNEWPWLDNTKEDMNVFANCFYWVGDFPNGDIMVQISKGKYKGKIVLIEHDIFDGELADEIVLALKGNETPDEIIEQCGFVYPNENSPDLLTYFISRIRVTNN